MTGHLGDACMFCATLKGVAAQRALARGQASLSMGQLVYSLWFEPPSNQHTSPPYLQVVAVFDADQAAHNFFFTSVLPWMDAGEDVAVVQSPQVRCPHSSPTFLDSRLCLALL